MPERIYIENLRIDDAAHTDQYQGPVIFANFNPEMNDTSYREKFPYIKTREVTLKNVTTVSGKPIRTSDNLFEFREVKVNILK